MLLGFLAESLPLPYPGCRIVSGAESGIPWCLRSDPATEPPRVTVNSCQTAYTDQLFIFSGSQIQLGNDTTKCLDAGEGMTAGSKLFFWDCNGLPQQQWGVDDNLGTIYLSQSEGEASLCMDMPPSFFLKGHDAHAQVWACNGLSNQRFRVQGQKCSGLVNQSGLTVV